MRPGIFDPEDPDNNRRLIFWCTFLGLSLVIWAPIIWLALVAWRWSS